MFRMSFNYFECICTAPNTFDDGSQLECEQCDQTCQTCYGPLSSNCLTCNKLYRQSELSSCVCPPEYYDVGQLECTKCHYSCYKCFNEKADGCIVCSLELSLRIIKGNICKCIDEYYDEAGISKCQKCSYRCEKCENQPDQCLSCPLNSKRSFDPIKGCPCPSEYFDQEDEINCQKNVISNAKDVMVRIKLNVSLVILLPIERFKLVPVYANLIILKQSFQIVEFVGHSVMNVYRIPQIVHHVIAIDIQLEILANALRSNKEHLQVCLNIME
ncbi:unnamed protein product [Paramecium octaurelia]|uniref:Uncharacterized protein n=1 Tax=Paramecium octaurelia TaxID=43137 RepID=A0A8S1SCK1_PAROT|nr:unnamed protein product [Paramecium octaurelia]